MMNAPQPFMGIRMHTGADVESQMYASFSREILNLSNSGREIEPETRQVMFDSRKIPSPKTDVSI